MVRTGSRRGSKQKKAVYDAVVRSCDHPTAESIFLLVRGELPGTSLSTVYRNLGILVSEGALAAVAGPGAEIHYDHNTGNHCHAQCRVCGRICDVQYAPVDYSALVPSRASGFKVDGVTVTFTGICDGCSKNERTGENNGS